MKKAVFLIVAIMVATIGVLGQKRIQSLTLGPVSSISPKSYGILPTPIESIGLTLGVHNLFYSKTSVWIAVCPDLRIKKFPLSEEYKIGFDYDLGKERGSSFKCSIGGVLGYAQYSGLTMLTGESQFASLKSQTLKVGPSFCVSYDLDRSVLERCRFFFRLDAHYEFFKPAIQESNLFGAMVGIEFMPFRW